MITRSLLLLSTLTLLTVCVDKVSASPVFQGKATTGEEVYLETDSIDSTNQSAVKFEYKIGKPGKKFDLVKAAANCFNGVISPQNPGDFPAYQPNATGATRKMYNTVCRISPGLQAGAEGDGDRRSEYTNSPQLTDQQKFNFNAFNRILIKEGNRFSTLSDQEKLSAINQLCSILRNGASVRGLFRAIYSTSKSKESEAYMSYGLIAAIQGGWCPEFADELSELSRP